MSPDRLPLLARRTVAQLGGTAGADAKRVGVGGGERDGHGCSTCLMTMTRVGLGTRISYSSSWGVRRCHRLGRVHPCSPVSRLRSAFWNDSCA